MHEHIVADCEVVVDALASAPEVAPQVCGGAVCNGDVVRLAAVRGQDLDVAVEDGDDLADLAFVEQLRFGARGP